MASRTQKTAMNFTALRQSDVPHTRKGKHNNIVTRLLSDLDQIKNGSAIKVPLSALDESKAKIRSALSRATRKNGRRVATASDDRFLYIWNKPKD